MVRGKPAVGARHIPEIVRSFLSEKIATKQQDLIPFRLAFSWQLVANI